MKKLKVNDAFGVAREGLNRIKRIGMMDRIKDAILPAYGLGGGAVGFADEPFFIHPAQPGGFLNNQ